MYTKFLNNANLNTIMLNLTNCLSSLFFCQKAREHRDQEEDKLAELNLKNNSLQELIATLKDGRGAAKVVEWHGKIEAVRLEELKQRRMNNKLQGQVGGSLNVS